MQQFWQQHDVHSEQEYHDILKAGNQLRPTLLLKERSNKNRCVFNAWIGHTLDSNSDLQVILDCSTCARYVVDYVNEANRGSS
ncbi:hypothetical protein HPB50_004670 [Hyalomma asiaticum]|uniref:Uncharacterized protein n=1 Tax=Hyalomma asiaticum TaxID=266040 RepID=A0ACB7RJ03_HYAAI|nr:hypothetical protein HPB50_004670 [Hyalomma asiaticum]